MICGIGWILVPAAFVLIQDMTWSLLFDERLRLLDHKLELATGCKSFPNLQGVEVSSRWISHPHKQKARQYRLISSVSFPTLSTNFLTAGTVADCGSQRKQDWKKRTPKTFSLCQFDGCNPWLACSALLNITLREAIFSSHECMIAKTIIVLKLPLRDSSVEVSNRKSAVEGDRIKYSLIHTCK